MSISALWFEQWKAATRLNTAKRQVAGNELAIRL